MKFRNFLAGFLGRRGITQDSDNIPIYDDLYDDPDFMETGATPFSGYKPVNRPGNLGNSPYWFNRAVKYPYRR